jgi:3',5'-cyclic AMP phosphodiesterase CpdA
LASEGPAALAPAQEVEACFQELESALGKSHYHTVQLSGLQPRTRYMYRVGDGANWSEWCHFDTANEEPAPFNFIYLGDAQNDIKSQWSRVVREAFRDAPRAAFVLHAGDLVNRADADEEWGEWFHGSGFIHSSIPAVPTPGNHEYMKRVDGSRGLTPFWNRVFNNPKNGPEGLEGTVYAIDYQGTRIISLNSNADLGRQAQWLESVLAENSARWTIVTFHHPVYSSGKGRENKALRDAWQPIFDKHRVDLVLQGHDHTYARTDLVTYERNLPTGVANRSAAGGTVYVVSVSGPKMYRLEERDVFARTATDTQLYQVIGVEADELRYEARTATGRLYDAFSLCKEPGRPNRLVELIPDGEQPEDLPPVEVAPAEAAPAPAPSAP